MHRAWALAGVLALSFFPLCLEARGGGYGGSHGSGHGSSHGAHSISGSVHGASHSGGHASTKTTGVHRDSRGRIKRSSEAKRDFQKSNPCPSTGKTSGSCPGYVVDHVVPLKRGGPDRPSNMQWQTVEEAKIKDRTE